MCDSSDLISSLNDFSREDLIRITHLRNVEGIEELVLISVATMVRWAFNIDYVQKEIISAKECESEWREVWERLVDIILFFNYKEHAKNDLPEVVDCIEIYSYGAFREYLIFNMMEYVKDPTNELMTKFANYCMKTGHFIHLWHYAEKHDAEKFLLSASTSGDATDNEYYMKKRDPNRKYLVSQPLDIRSADASRYGYLI